MTSPSAAWRPVAVACGLVVALVWAFAGKAEAAVAIIASTGIVLHRRRGAPFLDGILLVAATALAVVLVALELRAAFRPFGLESLVAAATIKYLLTRLAPLAGAMAVLASADRILGRPVGSSLLVASALALPCTLAASIAGWLTAIAVCLVAGDDLGLMRAELPEVATAVPYAVSAALVLPLFLWLGVRCRGPWPILCAVAAAMLAMPV